MVWFWSCCHPEPGPELDSGSIEFGISILDFKAPLCGRGTLLILKETDSRPIMELKRFFRPLSLISDQLHDYRSGLFR